MKSSYHVEFCRIPRQSEFTRFSRKRASGGTLGAFLSGTQGARVKLQFSQVELKVEPTMTHGMMPLDRKVKLIRRRDIIGIMGKFK